MTKLIGTKFSIGKTEYIVDSVEEMDSELKAVVTAMKNSGKDAAMYFASKVLKSGKKSKQGGMFYRFTESGNFIKVL